MDVHTALTWRKSSYSGGEPQSCVEVAQWRKSTYSGGSPQTCVEVAPLTDYVAVRDTKDRGRGTHVVHARAWQAFIEAVKTDRL